MSEKITCPDCKGKGYHVGFGCPGFYKMEITCPMCKGKKLVKKEVLQWIKEGDKLRVQRRAKNRSLREEAKRRKIQPSVLSEMEQGIRKPIFRE